MDIRERIIKQEEERKKNRTKEQILYEDICGYLENNYFDILIGSDGHMYYYELDIDRKIYLNIIKDIKEKFNITGQKCGRIIRSYIYDQLEYSKHIRFQMSLMSNE